MLAWNSRAAGVRRVDLTYASGWASPVAIIAGEDGGQRRRVALARRGPFRSPEEGLFRGVIKLQPGEGFWIRGENSGEDRPPGGGLYCPAAASLHLQDGEFFAEPPVGAPVPPEHFVRHYECGALGHTFRVRVLRPRQYRRREANLPLLLLNDGQNQWQEGMFGGWHTDAAATSLARAGRVRDVVLAAVEMHPKRSLAYLPRPLGRVHNYADFLARRVLPELRRELPLSDNPRDIGVCGSSWGAVAALHAAWRHPETFGMVAALSYSALGPSPFAHDSALTAMARSPRMPFHKAYFDAGEWFIEDPRNRRSDNTELTRTIISLFRERNWDAPERFRGFIAEGHSHNERWWRLRVPGMLEFLFPNETPAPSARGNLGESGDCRSDSGDRLI